MTEKLNLHDNDMNMRSKASHQIVVKSIASWLA